jgi:hypothetical protein
VVYEPEDEGPEPRVDDPAFIRACDDLREFFHEHNKELFYERQLCVLFEKGYFHWITARALKELADQSYLSTDLKVMGDLRDEDDRPLILRFYRHRSHRFWQRQAKEIAALVRRFADFGRSLGDYGELLCDAALWSEGFQRAAKNARSWDGKTWERTEHNLDRIYVKDSVAYGCEIKNTLKYFPPIERDIKQNMCAYLGLKPLFIVRWLPKSHIYETVQAGGFAILFEHQLYPIGHEPLAAEIRGRLGLPAHCHRELPEDAVGRLIKLHKRELADGSG